MKKRFYCAAAGMILLGGMLTGCGNSETAAENGKVTDTSRTSATTTTTVTTTKETTSILDTTEKSGVISDAKDMAEDVKDDVTSIMTKATSEIGTKR